MNGIVLTPIGFVRNARTAVEDDNWGGIISEIVLTDVVGPDALLGLDEFSHVDVMFYFDRDPDAHIETGARRPRNNPDWPEVGIFAQRGKNRPNRLGLTSAEVVAVEGRTLTVRGLDAIDGTPVLDIKPVMREFLPRSDVRQPAWSTELMAAYWQPEGP